MVVDSVASIPRDRWQREQCSEAISCVKVESSDDRFEEVELEEPRELVELVRE